MDRRAKARWLMNHYKPYSMKWYLSDDRRLDAIFDKVYSTYLTRLEQQLTNRRQKSLDEQFERMKAAYKAHYHADYEQDMKVSRLETFKRCQAISHLWAASQQSA